MSKLIALMRRAPKRFTALVAIAAAAVIVPAVVFAWGPSRPTFTQAHPASYVTFDSITDNPQVGDERNFVRIKEDGTNTYGDNVNLTPGKVYDVSVYYHNNAAANLNLVAHDTTLKMEVPGIVKSGVNAAFTGTISASNANPTSVWDEAYGKNTTNGDVALRYVANSATFVSNGAVNGQTLPDSLFTTGAKLGYNAQDGNLPGCNQFAGFVNFKIRVDQPNFTVSKLVSTDNGKTWGKTATTQPGATIQYGLSFQNTGTTQLDNVIVRDMLPAGVSYVNGSTSVINSNTGGQYKPTIDAVASSTGINAGSFQPSGNVFYKFSAKMPTEAQLQCGTNTLVNTERATTSAGYKEDTATVTINKECKPVVSYTCNALGITVVDRTDFTFKTAYSVQNATFKSVTYVIKDANGKVVDTKTVNGNTLNYSQKTPGKYSVQATITVSVNGQDKTATSAACQGNFEVPAQPNQITVCELDTKQIVTINENMFDSSKYSKTLADCATPPVTPPTTPPELPHTGASDGIVAIVGLGALIASAAYYVASRRALNQ
ncbi:MAG TPA: DUF11 domain-containing protein [Dongiaceae bacterium]|nr:DUF11 domain-containing protein [Dongiaceae bacterium]